MYYPESRGKLIHREARALHEGIIIFRDLGHADPPAGRAVNFDGEPVSGSHDSAIAHFARCAIERVYVSRWSMEEKPVASIRRKCIVAKDFGDLLSPCSMTKEAEISQAQSYRFPTARHALENIG